MKIGEHTQLHSLFYIEWERLMLKPVRLAVAAVAVVLSGGVVAAEQPAPSYLPASAAATFENAPAIVEGASGKDVKSTIYV
ncbi:MAG: hypothetical protein WBR17_28840, partial [Paraburkholderia sp.]